MTGTRLRANAIENRPELCTNIVNAVRLKSFSAMDLLETLKIIKKGRRVASDEQLAPLLNNTYWNFYCVNIGWALLEEIRTSDFVAKPELGKALGEKLEIRDGDTTWIIKPEKPIVVHSRGIRGTLTKKNFNLTVDEGNKTITMELAGKEFKTGWVDGNTARDNWAGLLHGIIYPNSPGSFRPTGFNAPSKESYTVEFTPRDLEEEGRITQRIVIQAGESIDYVEKNLSHGQYNSIVAEIYSPNRNSLVPIKWMLDILKNPLYEGKATVKDTSGIIARAEKALKSIESSLPTFSQPGVLERYPVKERAKDIRAAVELAKEIYL